MRHTVQQQQKLVPIPEEHPHAKELATISSVLDGCPEINDMIFDDLVAANIDPNKGRSGMTAEQVFRAMIVKQMTGFSYELLAFSILDSACYRAFCRIGFDEGADESTLQRNIKKVRPETLESINRIFVKEAKVRGIELGTMVRTDCTVEATNIHEPSDSTLLFDVVRVLARLISKAKEAGYTIEMTDHTRRAKRRMLAIQYAKNKAERVKLYRELVKLTAWTIGYAVQALIELADPPDSFSLDAYMLSFSLTPELENYIPLGRKVLTQTQRRVFWNEKVKATEKIVSIFEPHTDIIIKARRETLFGHKICLTTGKSGMILDCLVLDGNPADSTLAVDAIKRQQEIYGRVPRQSSFDGGFASKTNLDEIKALGVKDVMFHKKRGLKISEMAKSTWVYNKLRKFRAGIEGGISYLKRCFGLGCCTWRSLESFKAYTWASVLSANLLTLARHVIAT